MKYGILSSILSLALLAVVVPGASQAAVGHGTIVYEVRKNGGNIERNRNEILENRQVIREEMQTTREAIFQALRMHSGEQSAYQDKQIEATRRIADAEQQNASQRMRQAARAKEESGAMDPAGDQCLFLDALEGGGATSGGAGSVAASNAQRAISGGDPAVLAGGTQLAKSVVDDRTRLADAFGKTDATTDPSVLVNPSLDLEDPRNKEALERLMRNMVNPFPDRPVTGPELQTPEGVARAAVLANRSVYDNSMQMVNSMTANMRTEVMDRTAAWDAFIEDIVGYNRDVGDRLSEMEQIDIRVLRDYAPSQERRSKRTVMNERALLQTLIEQMSLNNRMAYISLELDTRRASLETPILRALLE